MFFFIIIVDRLLTNQEARGRHTRPPRFRRGWRFPLSIRSEIRPATTCTDESRSVEIYHQHGRTYADYPHGALLVYTFKLMTFHFVNGLFFFNCFNSLGNRVAVAVMFLLITSRIAFKFTITTDCCRLKKAKGCTSIFTK